VTLRIAEPRRRDRAAARTQHERSGPDHAEHERIESRRLGGRPGGRAVAATNVAVGENQPVVGDARLRADTAPRVPSALDATTRVPARSGDAVDGARVDVEDVVVRRREEFFGSSAVSSASYIERIID